MFLKRLFAKKNRTKNHTKNHTKNTPALFLEKLSESVTTNFIPRELTVLNKGEKYMVLFGENHHDMGETGQKNVIDTMFKSIDFDEGKTIVIVEAPRNACSLDLDREDGITRLTSLVCKARSSAMSSTFFVDGRQDFFEQWELDMSDESVLNSMRAIYALSMNLIFTWQRLGEGRMEELFSTIPGVEDQSDEKDGNPSLSKLLQGLYYPDFSDFILRDDPEDDMLLHFLCESKHMDLSETFQEENIRKIEKSRTLLETGKDWREHLLSAFQDEFTRRYRHFTDITHVIRMLVSDYPIVDALSKELDIMDASVLSAVKAYGVRDADMLEEAGIEMKKFEGLETSTFISTNMYLDHTILRTVDTKGSSKDLVIVYAGAMHTRNVTGYLTRDGWKKFMMFKRDDGGVVHETPVPDYPENTYRNWAR